VTVGNKTEISESVIGKGCEIGNSVLIRNSFIWSGVKVEDNCVLDTCIVSHGAHVKAGVKIKRGCVLGKGVVVGPYITLPESTLLRATPLDDSKASINFTLVGLDGKAYEFTPRKGYDKDSWARYSLWLKSKCDSSQINQENDDDEESTGKPAAMEDFQEEKTEWHDDLEGIQTFSSDVLETIGRCINENVAPDDLKMEINSSKHAYNIPARDVSCILFYKILEAALVQTLEKKKVSNSASFCDQLISLLKKMQPILENYISSSDSQSDCLSILEYVTLGNISTSQSDANMMTDDDTEEVDTGDGSNSEKYQLSVKDLLKVILHLYNEDIFDEEIIIKWSVKPCELPQIVTGAPGAVQITKEQQKELRTNPLLQGFIEWLNEEDDDDDEEDEEEEDDDEESD